MSEMHETNSKILIVGWDGGTWSAFRPLAERGVMPNLKALMDRGAFGVLESTMPAITAPAWTTMMTGLRPETHGIYSFIDGKLFDDPLEPDDQPVSARSVRFPTLLEYFAAAGRRVACINEPMSYPPREVNGIMITGMLTPAGATDFTWPKELTAELDGYVIDLYGGVDWVAQELPGSRLNDEQYVRRCTEILAARARNVCRLAETHPADFTFVVFTGTDRIFHRLWPEVAAYVERSAPEGALEKALEEFFRAMDDALGRVMAACGAAHVMIVSDHGFGPKLPHTVYPNVCLEENGFLVRRAGGSPASLLRRVRGALRRALRRVMETVLPRGIAVRLFAKVGTRATRVYRSLDLEKSQAYFVNVDCIHIGAVRLVKESTAALSAADRETLIDCIIAALKEMTDPATGEKVAEDVLRARDYLQAEPPASFPEIIVSFREDYTGRSDPLEAALVGGPATGTPGAHRMEGMYVLAGDAVWAAGESAKLTLADVAPTTLYLAGLAVPRSMQGAAPTALFREEALKARPVSYADAADASAAAKGDAYTREQEASVKDHLRSLGYMD